jgi:hypothetical protein
VIRQSRALLRLQAKNNVRILEIFVLKILTQITAIQEETMIITMVLKIIADFAKQKIEKI